MRRSVARTRPGASFFSALLATAIFRCWHILLVFAGWSTFVTGYESQSTSGSIWSQNREVLGFIISYRTTSSFERYNEGRRLWSNIIFATRSFARMVWFHVPDAYPGAANTAEAKRRSLIEKKTMLNLTEAFAVAVKHYLRGEDGIYYSDLYFLVKFLPAYALPTGIPQYPDMSHASPPVDPAVGQNGQNGQKSDYFDPEKGDAREKSFLYQRSNQSLAQPGETAAMDNKIILAPEDEKYLLPASMPPKYHWFDFLTKRGLSVKGQAAARLRAKMKNKAVTGTHNLPLEISLYLSSYISALQQRKVMDVPTTNSLLAALTMLVDSLTGLERILTTPIPFSYSIHLWLVAIIYNLALPLQIWKTLGWVTIPASIITSFIFFGFMVAGEEIENPFGYDKNDLNLDHFTNNIIRNELIAITSSAPPDPANWAFAPENDCVFSTDYVNDERVTPDEWVSKGVAEMLK
ncbi:Bestrophin, RFP-TM, chloride channel-domain-containing protein [Flagelloscypha sp. PMI_526]|nr:Bestrophin, RFP-TM, chloride channel-domain-containing protein [Flagelloscypha sp. PMI_526]